MINEYILTKNTNIKDKETKRLLMIAYRISKNMELTPNQVKDWDIHSEEHEVINYILKAI